MKIKRYVVGMLQTNCYMIIHEDTKECIIIDPGAGGKKLVEKIKADGLRPVAILLTHGHFDHVKAAKFLSEEFGILVYAHEKEMETLKDPQKNASVMMNLKKTYDADIFVKDHEILNLADVEIEVLHTPGHTKGGCCYYIPTEGVLFSGDTLFAQSVGRTDLAGGSMSQLIRSITEKILPLNEAGNWETDIMVYTGHGEATTIETERMNNPYL